MSDVYKQLRQQCEAAEAEHAANQKVYHDLLKQKNDIEAKLRPACEVASASANVLAGLKAALDKMPKPDLQAVQ